MSRQIVNIFCYHPRLVDYRKPLFDLVNRKFRVRFFFQHKTSIPNNYHIIYTKKERVKAITLSDIVHLYEGVKNSDVFISSFLSNYYSIVGVFFAKLLNKKVIIWEEISYFFKGRRFVLKYFILREIAKHIDAFFAVGEPQQLALQKLGVSTKKIFIVNEYPGYVYYKVKSKEINSLHVRGKKVILYLGRFVPFKGIENLLKAYSLLEEQYANIILLIVGYGPLEKQLKEYAKHLHIKNIKFLGPITDINEKKYLFEISSMLVVPSIIDSTGRSGIEGGPIVVLEALSAGTPVVGTTGLISSSKFICNGFNGFVVPHSNPNALFEKMAEILQWRNEEKIRERIIEGFKKLRGHQYQFEQIEKAVNYCLGRNK